LYMLTGNTETSPESLFLIVILPAARTPAVSSAYFPDRQFSDATGWPACCAT